MYRQLVQNEKAPKLRGYVHHRPIPKTRLVREIPLPPQEKGWDLTTILVIASILTLLTTLPLIIVKSRTHSFPVIWVEKLPTLQIGLLEPHAKNLYYAKLPVDKKNEFTDLVKYLAGIIRTTKNESIKAEELAYTIVSESLAADYDPLFVASLILAESSFKKHARSSVGALGLMQLRPSTGKYISSVYGVKWHGTDYLKDPQYNIQLGIAYLKYLQEMFKGNLTHALIAYNWGPGNMIQAVQNRKKSVPRECLAYSRKILKNHTTWRAELSAQALDYENITGTTAKG